MSSLLQDIRYAFRSLRKTPGFTSIAVVTLALGIGANTAIFSVVNAVLLRPLPYPESDRLVDLATKTSQNGRFALAYPDIQELRKLTKDFSGIAAISQQRYNLAGQEQAREVNAAVVTDNLFSVLQVGPSIGRPFTADETREQLAVVSYALWASEFGSDRNIIGKPINLDGRPFTVVGVMPAGFTYPNEDTQLWVPFGEALRSDPQLEFNRHFYAFTGVARLAPGATLQQAQADLNVVAQRITQAERDRAGGGERRVEINMRQRAPGGGPRMTATNETAFAVQPLRDQTVGDEAPRALFVLLGAVGLVLLIACANAAGLLVARATRRQKEIAVRRALGANRGRIARQLLTESTVLALLAGATGMVLSYWGVSAVLAAWPNVLPRTSEIGIDARVLGFALAVSVLTGLAFGLIPALRASHPKLEAALRDDAGTTTGARGRRRAHGALIATEIALALVLLVGAGLLIKSFTRLTSVELGYDTHNVLAARVRLTPSRYPATEQQLQFFQQLTDALRENPNVATVSLSRTLPLSGGVQMLAFDPRQVRPDAPQPFMVSRLSVVAPEYFATTGIQLRGRDFTAADREGAPKVVIINQRLAEELWPGQDPLGKTFPVSAPGGQGYDATVIGVIGDIHYASLDAPLMPELYLPYAQAGNAGQVWVLARARTAALSLGPVVRDAVKRLDPGQPIGELVSMEQVLSRSTAARRFNMTLLTIFAGLALVLALVGIYGLTAYAVTQRTRELGLRMAVGAEPGSVVLMLLRENLWLVVAGLIVGTAGAYAGTRVLQSLLFEVSTKDLATFVGAAVLLALVAMGATLIPARRAARIDPVEALRYE